jgi:egghead protein (zeste-white 4 protein)
VGLDFSNYLWIIWILSSLLFIRFYIYFFPHRSNLIARPTKDRFGTPKIIFQVTTKGNIGIVQGTVDRVNSVCREISYKKYEIWVVTDAQEKFEGCRTIVVPPNYSCNAIYKARALQYAVEIRKKEHQNDKNTYIFHLDDESLIAKQTLCSILSYVENDPKPISEGLIIYPIQEKEPIKISNLMDTLRPFCCFECLELMNVGNPAYIHGSNLLVRSDVEEEVGWKNGKTLSEDTLFAINAKIKYGPNIFGWHGGVVEEKSPLNLKDLMKQRRRWFYGLIQNMKYFNRKEKIRQTFRTLIWIPGLISAIVSVIAWIIPQSMPFTLRVFFTITSAMWLFSYQIGAFFNGKYLPLKKRIRFHFLTLIFAFAIGLLECLTPLIAFLRKPKTFEVIRK